MFCQLVWKTLKDAIVMFGRVTVHGKDAADDEKLNEGRLLEFH